MKVTRKWGVGGGRRVVRVSPDQSVGRSVSQPSEIKSNPSIQLFNPFRGFRTRMVYLDSIACLRYTTRARNPCNFFFTFYFNFSQSKGRKTSLPGQTRFARTLNPRKQSINQSINQGSKDQPLPARGRPESMAGCLPSGPVFTPLPYLFARARKAYCLSVL